MGRLRCGCWPAWRAPRFSPWVRSRACGTCRSWPAWQRGSWPATAGWLRASLPAAVIVAAAGWGAAVGWLALRDGLPEASVARTIAALGGLPAHPATGIAVTLLVAAIQAAAGLWLGRALAPGQAR